MSPSTHHYRHHRTTAVVPQTMQAITQERYGVGRHLAPGPDRAADDRRRRGPDPHPRRRARPRHLAPDDRQALRHAPRLRPARAEEEPGARARRRRHGRRRRRRRHRASPSATRCSASARARSPSTPRPSADKLAHKPATSPSSRPPSSRSRRIAAWQAVHDVGRVEAGQRVLVIGASGGVGSYAVQLAEAFGAEVTGVASTAEARPGARPRRRPRRRLHPGGLVGPGPALRRDHRHRRATRRCAGCVARSPRTGPPSSPAARTAAA